MGKPRKHTADRIGLTETQTQEIADLFDAMVSRSPLKDDLAKALYAEMACRALGQARQLQNAPDLSGEDAKVINGSLARFASAVKALRLEDQYRKTSSVFGS